MKTNAEIEEIIVSYLENNICEEDLRMLENWLDENAENRKLFDQYRTIRAVSGSLHETSNETIKREWTKFEKRNLSKRRSLAIAFARIAAIFIAGAFISWAANQYLLNDAGKNLTGCEINAPLGSKSIISLPDGSKVFLNAGSTLKYDNSYGKGTREVQLNGEAFFEVAKDKTSSFQVKTSGITVKAYGTRFNVKSYSDERTIETTLVEGSVSIRKNGKNETKGEEFFMKPEEHVTFYKATNKLEAATQKQTDQTDEKSEEVSSEKFMISKGIDTQLFTSWTEDKLIMKSEALQKMVVKIERKYNVKIHFENEELKNFRFSGVIENETIESVMTAISIASSIEYSIQDRDIWLRKKSTK